MRLLRKERSVNKKEADSPEKGIVLPEVCIQEAKQKVKGFEWFSENKREEALGCLRMAQKFNELGNQAQVGIQVRRLKQVTFEDFTERKGINIVPLLIEKRYDGIRNHDKGYNFRFLTPQERIEAHPYLISNAPFRIPHGVLDLAEKLEGFPFPGIIEDIEIWDEIDGDPLLVAKVAGQWYSLYNWERFGPTIILKGL